MSLIGNTLAELRRSVAAEFKRRASFTAIADAAAVGKVKIKRHAATPETTAYARLDGFDVGAADDLVCLVVNGKPICAKLLRGTPTNPAKISGRSLQVWNSGQTQVVTLDNATGDISTWGQGVFSKGVNSPVTAIASQDNSDTGSSTDTVNYVTAQSLNVVLPAGTWTVRAIGWLSLQHSAAGQCGLNITIAGTTSGGQFVTCPTTSFTVIKRANTVTGIAGSQTITVELTYRPVAAGTAVAENPALLVVAIRTA